MKKRYSIDDGDDTVILKTNVLLLIEENAINTTDIIDMKKKLRSYNDLKANYYWSIIIGSRSWSEMKYDRN